MNRNRSSLVIILVRVDFGECKCVRRIIVIHKISERGVLALHIGYSRSYILVRFVERVYFSVRHKPFLTVHIHDINVIVRIASYRFRIYEHEFVFYDFGRIPARMIIEIENFDGLIIEIFIDYVIISLLPL